MRKNNDRLFLGLVWTSVIISVSFLVLIVSYIFVNGFSTLSWDFISGSTEPESVYTYFNAGETYDFTYEITSDEKNSTLTVTEVNSVSTPLVDSEGANVNFYAGSTITKIDGEKIEDMSQEEIVPLVDELKAPTQDTKVMLTVPGGGILPLILTTILSIVIAVGIAIPFGLFAAIYLVEYKVNPRLDKFIHFAIDSLAAIPSIIFGLFGYIFFCITMGFGLSLLSGILTVTIMLLPIVIKTIEEALHSVPQSYRESSYGLGATKSQTIFKVVLPSALPGIIVAMILATSRVIGESAIFIFTAGTTAQFAGLMQQGATLTVYAYSVTREFSDIATASAIGIVIITIVLVLNLTAKFIQKKFYLGSN